MVPLRFLGLDSSGTGLSEQTVTLIQEGLTLYGVGIATEFSGFEHSNHMSGNGVALSSDSCELLLNPRVCAIAGRIAG